jgi:hypothetical protein
MTRKQQDKDKAGEKPGAFSCFEIGLKMNYSFLTLHFTTPTDRGRGAKTALKKELRFLCICG